MSPKGSANLESGNKCAEALWIRIDRALASLGEAEMNLRQLRASRLPAMAESLASAASELEALRLLLPAGEFDKGIYLALRSRIGELGHVSGRVCALYAAASGFHAGLALVREKEAAGYDALGAVHSLPHACRIPHSLETRG